MVIGGVPIFRYNKKECEKISFYHYTSLKCSVQHFKEQRALAWQCCCNE